MNIMDAKNNNWVSNSGPSSMSISFPKMAGKRWKALIIVAVIATFVRIMLQPLIPAGQSQVEPSAIVDAGLLIPAFTFYAFIAYTVMCYAFVMLEGGLPWSRMRKGLAFGSMLGLIWVAYLYEPVPLGQNTPFIESLAYPMADGLSVLVLGLLLGRFVATEPALEAGKQAWKPLALLLVPAMMVVIRLFEYNVLHIYSSYAERMAATMAWVILTGLGIGFAYMVLRSGVPTTTPSGRSVNSTVKSRSQGWTIPRFS
jgi:hypothetical protein